MIYPRSDHSKRTRFLSTHSLKQEDEVANEASLNRQIQFKEKLKKLVCLQRLQFHASRRRNYLFQSPMKMKNYILLLAIFKRTFVVF